MPGHDYGDGNDVGRAVAELLPGFTAARDRLDVDAKVE
jgi:hypothetical protein